MSDVIDLILDDHRLMKAMLHKLRDDQVGRPVMIPLLETLITAHERAEEDEVYPAVRRAGDADAIAHSQREHLLADTLLSEIAGMAPEDDGFDDALDRLSEAVLHHLDEEEESILTPMPQWLDAEERRVLGEEFLRSRTTHLGERADDISRYELVQQAENLGVPVSSMTKDELKEDLRGRADK